jgi:DNA-binding CsgD family transcriptional regulator/PAS domain-containing protein
MDEFDPSFVADLVGHVYEAAVDPGHWGEFVTALERVYPESRVTLFGHADGCPTSSLAARVNYDENDLRSYADYYIGCSPYIARSAILPTGRAFHYDMLIGDDELMRTEYYNDYLRPRRLGHYGTGLIIERPHPRRATVLSLADHSNDEDRRTRQLRLLDLLAPHLRRALRLHRTVAAERASAAAAQAAFDHWTHAAVVLDSSARVVTFNLAAATLLKRGDGLWLGRAGQLCAADETRAQALEAAIRKCAATADRADARATDLDGITLPRPFAAAPLRVMMWPLPPGALTDDRRGSVLAVILDPTQVRRTPVAWLAKQFGLSPAEQRLTEAVVNGLPLAEAAGQLGIRISTARTRLKAIQTKTGCHRQVDLVRLALSLPAVRLS